MRKAQRLAQRRRLIVSTVAVAVAASVVGAGALVATDTLRIGGGTPPALADRAAPTTSPPTTAARRPDCRDHLTSDDPHRLWIGGDSLAGSLGPALGERAAGTGVALPTFDSRVSSGLSNPDFFDWPKHATEEMFRLDPEVVVFIIGTNDWRAPRPQQASDGQEPEWRREYALAIEDILDILDGEGDARPVYWIGAPPLQEDRKDQGARQINDVAREVIGRHRNATYVDEYDLFAVDGEYSATLPDDNGKNVRVRAGDGIHFTPAGGEVLSDAVFALLDDRCRLDEQADPDHPQKVTEAPGSGRAPGSGSGSGSSTSKPPATAPPTAPPTTSAPTTSPPITLLPPPPST